MMRIAATEQPERDPDAAPRTAAPPKKDFARHLVVSKKAHADAQPPAQSQAQATDADPAKPQTLGQIIVALMNAGGAATQTPDAQRTVATPKLDVPTTQIAAAAAGDAAIPPELAVAALVAKPDAAKPELPMTPLEQAVHDLLSALGTGTEEHARPEPAMPQAPLAPTVAPLDRPEAIAAPLPVAEVAPAQTPTELVSQHHAHIVLDEPGLRVVMTVAVRGSEVTVNVRSSDDQTAAALARNAGSLDEAMRAQKLDLSQFTAEHETPRDRDRPTHDREPERNAKSSEPFTLEETP